MAGNDQADFAKRLKRIQRSNSRGRGAQFKRQGSNNFYPAQKITRKKSNSSFLHWVILFGAIYLFFAFAKSFIAFQMGPETYAARIAPLAQGEPAQKTIAAVMGLGTVEQAMIKGLGNALGVNAPEIDPSVEDVDPNLGDSKPNQEKVGPSIKKEDPENSEPSDLSN